MKTFIEYERFFEREKLRVIEDVGGGKPEKSNNKRARDVIFTKLSPSLRYLSFTTQKLHTIYV